MKYGVITHKTTMNLGDDIQTYAAVKLLPHVDYHPARESIDNFTSENNEPVGVLMGAWWLWSKWNWPPAECIYPLLISMHINEYDIYTRGSPIKRDWLKGIGGDYFRAYGPVGCRDTTSMEIFKSCGIDHYLSGCLTLTLPKQKKTADAGTYACLVDLRPELETKAREWLKDTGLKIVKLSHHCDYRNTDLTFDQRMEKVEEILTLYQNAKVVITRRLHVTLPCMAMETPVVSIVNLKSPGNYTRWAPYSDWVHYISEKDFINHAFDYDFNNPPENKSNYLPVRQSLIKQVEQFISETKDLNEPIQMIKKTAFSEAEARQWQYELMRSTLDKWLHASRRMNAELSKLKKKGSNSKKSNKLSSFHRCIKFAKRKIKALLRIFGWRRK